MKKLSLICVAVALSTLTGFAQCDMFSGGLTITPPTITVGQTAIFSFNVQNDAGGPGNCVEPPNSVRVVVSLPVPTVYAFDSLVTPASGSDAFFTYTYNPVNRTIVGINHAPLDDFDGSQLVEIRVTGVAPGSAQSALNIGANPSGVGYTDLNPSNNNSAVPLAVTMVLPLKIKSFAGSTNLCNNILSFVTTEEKNVARIDVERSEDARNFKKIDEITPKNSLTENSYTYSSDAVSPRSFYRLKITDVDGRFIYTDVATITSECKQALASVYPNPARVAQDITVSIKNFEGKINGILQDVQGKILQKITLFNGVNKVNLGNYAQGTYILTIADEINQTKTVKLVTYK